MKVKALCNVLYGAALYVCGDVFEINEEDAPGLKGAVAFIESAEKPVEEEKEPEAKAEEPKPAATRKTRKTTRKS